MIDECYNNLKYTEKAQEIYPPLADSIQCASDTSDWGVGSWVELVPADTITDDFIAVGLITRISSIVTAREFELHLGKGAGGSEVQIAAIGGRFVYSSSVARFFDGWPWYFRIPIKVDANTRIAVRAADDNTSALNYRLKLLYMKLPL